MPGVPALIVARTLVSAALRLVSTLFQHWIIGIWGR